VKPLTVAVDGKHYRGTWDTWEDHAWGRMVEVTFRDAYCVRMPTGEESPEHVAERCLRWCVGEAFTSDRRR
jgi:hypothetical protein